jgi:predicted nucleotidyltransferase
MNERQITTYAQELVSDVVGIESIWLFGSRANESFRPDSDWDLMVFANQEAFDELKKRTDLKNESVDVIVVIEKKTFSEPWPENPATCKSGDFLAWDWKIVTPDSANYTSVKYCSEAWFKNDQANVRKLLARLIWR